MTSIKNFLSFNPDEKGFVLLAEEAEAVQVKGKGSCIIKYRSNEMAEYMFIDTDMDKRYWDEAIHIANYLQNILPTKHTGKTPYESWYSKLPDIKNLRSFGTMAYAHVPQECRRKLDKKAKKLRFFGYSEESKVYRSLNTATDKVKISRNVIILETHKEPGIEEIIFEEKGPKDESEDKNKESKDIQDSEPRRSNKGASPDMHMGVLNMAVSLGEPKDRKDALSRPDAELWIKAMDEEMDSLKNNKTWDLVIPPKKQKVIGCIWGYKIKKKHRRRN